MKLKQTRIKFRLRLKKLYLNLRHTHLKDLRNVVLLYAKKLPNIVHLKNLVLFNSILAVLILVLFFQRFSSLAPYYQKVNPAYGGSYREGVIGLVEKINPLFIQTDAEAAANKLVFSGLTRVLPNNEVIPDLAESWSLQADGRTYVFKLRDDLVWHDEDKLDADDVIFTYNLIQNPDTKTNLSAIWKGVVVEKVNDKEIKFTLSANYPNFLAVVSQPILPSHLLGDVEAKNVKVAEFFKKPVGSGPYKFIRFDQAGNDSEIIFRSFEQFAISKPYITSVKLRTYNSFEDLYSGLVRKQIDGITEIPFDKNEKVNKISNLNNFNSYLPRYKMIIFNLKQEYLADKNVRKAILSATNKDQIVKDVVKSQAITIAAPILPGQPGYSPSFRQDTFNVALANELLDKAGWVKVDGLRKKAEKTLSINLVVPNDAESTGVANIFRENLKQIGIDLQIKTVDSNLLQANHIRPRNFDLIMVGQEVGLNPDLYSFWHSTQINDPGLNISGFSNREVDKLLEQSRKTGDRTTLNEKNKRIQEIILEETPAIFLYNPIYTIAISKNIYGYKEGNIGEPVDHLNSIYLWYNKINYTIH